MACQGKIGARVRPLGNGAAGKVTPEKSLVLMAPLLYAERVMHVFSCTQIRFKLLF